MTVDVYTTPSCKHCKDVKELLEENGIDYREHNVAEDREKAKELVKKSGQRGVPVTVVGDGDDEQVIVGNQPDKLKEAVA